MTTKPKSKTLYAFTFVGGGYNQVYAYTKREAIKKAKQEFNSSTLTVDESSFRRIPAKEVNSYYSGISRLFD